MKEEKFDFNTVIEGINFEQIHKHPNILIAARFWDDARYNAAVVCYKFMRKIDDLIDDRKASGIEITECEKHTFTQQVNEWISCLRLLKYDDKIFNDIAKTVHQFNIPLELFQAFSRSMIYDINNNGFDTFEQFIDYSMGASVAPASIFVHLCCLNNDYSGYVLPEMDVVELAKPCAMFSYLVHIIRDFEMDQKSYLNYFANDILLQNNLTAEDLTNMALTRNIKKEFRNVVRFYMEKAYEYRKLTVKAIEKLIPYLSPRYRVSLEVIFTLYDQVFQRIDIEKGYFTMEELNPTPDEIKTQVLKLVSTTYMEVNE
ncbi:MAG: squalene/phytoene synthase family protein [Bacteroidales bacterium]|nr:squalene/phytoene synthase family protein [Bacteroidales bacterium]